MVKAFNHITSAHLTEHALPAGRDDRRALALAGDDTEAKATVAALIDELGFDTVDVGLLGDSWRIEPNTPGYGPRLDEAGCATRSRRRTADAALGSPVLTRRDLNRTLLRRQHLLERTTMPALAHGRAPHRPAGAGQPAAVPVAGGAPRRTSTRRSCRARSSGARRCGSSRCAAPSTC